MIATVKGDEKAAQDLQFQTFLFKLIDVAKFNPKAKYLYPIMQGVAFKDLEVALDMAIMEGAAHTANDI